MDRKPWYQREDFWTAVGTIIAVFVGQFYEVEFSIPAFVTFALMVVTLIWSTTKMEETAMAYRAQERLADKAHATAEIELQIARLKK